MIWQISIREGMKAAEQRMKELQKLILETFDLLSPEDQEHYFESVRAMLLQNAARNEWAED